MFCGLNVFHSGLPLLFIVSQFSPAAIRQEFPSGMVMMMVQLPLSSDDKTSMTPPLPDRPIATGVSENFLARCLTIRRWMLHLRSDKALEDLAEIANPHIRGWINDFGTFYRTALRPTLKRIDLYVIRWARRKFKRLRRKSKGARDWFDRLRRATPTLFDHWQLCHGNGRTSGAV